MPKQKPTLANGKPHNLDRLRKLLLLMLLVMAIGVALGIAVGSASRRGYIHLPMR